MGVHLAQHHKIRKGGAPCDPRVCALNLYIKVHAELLFISNTFLSLLNVYLNKFLPSLRNLFYSSLSFIFFNAVIHILICTIMKIMFK